MILNLLNYNNISVPFKLNQEKENIKMINLSVISGDEVAKIYYNNGEIQKCDSSNDRFLNYFDGDYIIYDTGINLIDNPNWLNRRNSYTYLSYNGEE